MKLYKLLLPALCAFVFSCKDQPGSTLNKILNRDQPGTLNKILNQQQLASQFFNVNINSDTILVTKQGCIIKIPKQSLQSDSNNVKLEVKEALTTEQIVLAGLTTMSGQQILSSDGMIYINAAGGYKVSIKKQLEVLVPTKTYNPDMNIFKGEQDQNGKIDWKDSQPLPKDETITKIDTGEILFKSNCANCHKIYDDFTGPALYGITDRKSKQWLYDFTRNPRGQRPGAALPRVTEVSQERSDKIMGDTTPAQYDYSYPDFYSECLLNRWAPVKMTAFQDLRDDDLAAIYSYIKAQSDKRPALKETYKANCCDSCEAYRNAIQKLQTKRENLVNRNEVFFNLDRIIPLPVVPDTIIQPAVNIPPFKKKVVPVYAKATYYTMNIQAMGWYNIDILMKDTKDNTRSELFVRIQGSYKIDVNLVLVIPSEKVFVEGGKLDDGEQYGFFETDGKIPLPENLECYVMAFAEYKDKVVFGKASFISKEKQTIDITLSETTSESMKAQIKALNLDGVRAEVKETKNAKEIRDTDLKMKETEKLKPKNCNCDGKMLSATDSTKLALLTK